MHIKFDNRNPYKARLNGEPLAPEKAYDVDAVVDQLLREHTNPKVQAYLNGIRQYITYEDEPILNCWPTKRYLDQVLPKFCSEEDLRLEIQLIHDIHEMGCHVIFLFSIRNLKDDEIKKITPLLIEYIGRFEDLSADFELILDIGRKGNYQATDFLIEEFKKPNMYKKKITDDMTDYQKSLAWNGSARWAVSNALLQIRDKSRLDDYIGFTKNEDMRYDCVFIVELIGHIKCEKSYDCLTGLLNDETVRVQAAALNALRLFYKYDGIEEHVRPFLDSEDAVLREYAGKIMKKIEKDRLKNKEGGIH